MKRITLVIILSLTVTSLTSCSTTPKGAETTLPSIDCESSQATTKEECETQLKKSDPDTLD